MNAGFVAGNEKPYLKIGRSFLGFCSSIDIFVKAGTLRDAELGMGVARSVAIGYQVGEL